MGLKWHREERPAGAELARSWSGILPIYLEKSVQFNSYAVHLQQGTREVTEKHLRCIRFVFF
jgi:hypothetical protein